MSAVLRRVGTSFGAGGNSLVRSAHRASLAVPKSIVANFGNLQVTRKKKNRQINSMAFGNHCDYRDNLGEKALERDSTVFDMHKLLCH